MNTYAIGLYEKAVPGNLNLREKLEIAGNTGFDFLEISIDESEEKLRRLDMGREERLELIKIMYETGTPIRSMCLSGHRRYPMGSGNPETEKRSMEIMEKAIDLADCLGIRVIMLAGYDVYYENRSHKTEARFLENLKKAVGMAARSGIVLAFETMETEFMNTVEKAMKYVQAIHSPYLQVYPDIGNITNAATVYGKSVLEDLKCGEGYLVAMHLKETLPGIFRDLMFGEGDVNFEDAIRLAWKMGVRRYVTEFWYSGSNCWEQELKAAYQKMDTILSQQPDAVAVKNKWFDTF